ncbi:P-loop containing nucleoside triphosphate hydrolase protein [Coniophora puteana RWD-64-598 SS2]|uniref:P-loop containing nucleoside triphosphate hydrolase protein n=1 Tax=Coniophora puteana (strain RWD-64-598) TaxID=741705 RepID=A0A5M3N2B1_CONPW|nr:P-loop containing nucleoside triphosphate hydrolase protein [Coniophora puteana RWD-64-598 SS2]EIW85519.1 P-loop containing nucleoside triphosphate hydrolase protein [Coniophora puteana RWD-64-598 SS2]
MTISQDTPNPAPDSTTTAAAVSESLLPRNYQEEIFRRAQEGNVIAALDTGSGKTFISILLIKWMVLQEHARDKVIVFLVPKVALVEQQASFISKHTPSSFRVKKFHGSLDLDLADRGNWQKSFEGSDVVVMTAQIFLNILTHSHWSIEKVSLLIFDECHHTRKNHAYNGVMREYFTLSTVHRPKVFGMTASPIWNPKDAQGSLLTLEKNLNATVIAVREHLAELLEHSPRPLEIIKEYVPPPDNYIYLKPSLWDCISVFAQGDTAQLISWDKLKMRYFVTRNTLGPYCADLNLYHDIKAKVRQEVEEIYDTQLSQRPIDLEDPAFAMDVDDGTPDNFEQDFLDRIPDDLKHIDAIVSEFTHYFDRGSTSPSASPSPSASTPPSEIPITIPLAWCAPKVKALVDVLLEHHSASPGSFHGIVFVEQRHVAMCLAKILPRIPELREHIRCAELVGHGTGHQHKKNQPPTAQARGMGLARQQDIVRSFREGKLNLLIATSVAEEGLDFPACDIVVRFDPVHHMVGYVQSRGRARTKTSAFVIMVQAGYDTHRERYRNLSESEPELKKVYQSREQLPQPEPEPSSESEEGEVEEEDPADIAVRERYVVPSTGAALTYGSAIGLVNYLCSLLPHDQYTEPPTPKYFGDYAATLDLPASLPLPLDKRRFRGPIRRSKREAKRAVAFMAVKELHKLNVFDDYLLPSSGAKGRNTEDADGVKISETADIPDDLDVMVRDPWVLGPTLWMHKLLVDGKVVAGLVTGTSFPPVELMAEGSTLRVRCAYAFRLDEDSEWERFRMLDEYTKLGLWFCVTGRRFVAPTTCFLVPLTIEDEIDYAQIRGVLREPYGSPDWSRVKEEDLGRTMVMNTNQHGRPLILQNIREDLTAMSTPMPGTREDAWPTYYEFWVNRWTRKDREADVPKDCPLIGATYAPRKPSGAYRVQARLENADRFKNQDVGLGLLAPRDCCRIVHFPPHIYNAFHLLPKVCRRLTDVYRAQAQRFELGLPPIADDLLIEAASLPTTLHTWNNQRFETLGDSVLKLGVTVHIMNKYPHRHEGQLSKLRQSSVSNRTLLARAKEIGLEIFLNSETQSLQSWRYVHPSECTASASAALTAGTAESPSSKAPARRAKREFPRRSLQDCMEATLGAAFYHGGMDMALRAGTALGLSFGGELPWCARYGRVPDPSPAPPLFEELQSGLGYEFHRGDLLVEAATHPSFATSAGASYQRLEFLGDALLDVVVMRYLFHKYPRATSGQLSVARSRAVCGPTLASVAVKRLNLHQILLINNVELSIAISRHVPLLQNLPTQEIVLKAWKYDPPKALSDIMESVFGAVLVDSAYNYEKAAAVVEEVMSEVLELISPSVARDPVTDLMLWSAAAGCSRITFQKSQSHPELRRNDSISVLAHGIVIVGPVTAANPSLSKGLASERARAILDDPTHEFHIKKMCNCREKPKDTSEDMDMDGAQDGLGKITINENDITDETEEGFAVLARQKLDESRKEEAGSTPEGDEEEVMYEGGDNQDMDIDD